MGHRVEDRAGRVQAGSLRRLLLLLLLLLRLRIAGWSGRRKRRDDGIVAEEGIATAVKELRMRHFGV